MFRVKAFWFGFLFAACGTSEALDGSGGDEDAGPRADTGSPTPATGSWIARAPFARGPRQETAVVELGGEIYAIGGFDARPATLNIVEAYDPTNDRWRDVAPLPLELHHANAAVARGKIFILGFLVSSAFTADPRGFAYDPDRDAWDPVASLPNDRARGAAAIAAHAGKIYLFGGFRNGSVADADVYDPETNTWTALPPLPRTSDHLVAGSIANAIYVAGGRSRSILSAQLDVFDPLTNEWSLGPPMPTARAGTMGAVLGQRLYVFGGEGNRGEASGVFAAAEAFDATAQTWIVLAPMTSPRHGTGAAALGDRIYVPGGADVQAFSAVSTHEAFVPEP